ncbi:DUF7695 domain-containing protein [Neisseria mucosa]|uniref:DUF7695 domain-containing protein n=1 Tax=Neisseriaceae TaxID=481 RepID=UPI000B28A3D7
MKKLIINRAKCLLCNDVITSEYSHDFKTCKCGNLSIDGESAIAFSLLSGQKVNGHIGLPA